MWIESIHIGGFGVFCKAEISSLPPGLCLFIGDNEAGKSTLLAFVRFMLYGMSKKKSEDGNRYLPLTGGNHGGIIQVRTAQNKSIQVHRDFPNAAGSVTVFDEKNRAVGGSVFEELLAGTNKELYRNVYGFSLQELQNFASLEADQIKSVLYGAAMGAGILALPKAQKNLNDKIGEIFKPTGVLPRLNKKLIEVGEIRKCIEDIQNNLSVSKFDDINRQLKDLDSSLRNKGGKLVGQKEALEDVEKTVKHYAEWSKLVDKKKESSTLPDDSALFPDDCLSILEQEISSFKVYSSNLEKARQDLEDAQLDAESQVADSLMLQAGNEIADLRKDLRQSALCFRELADFRNAASLAEKLLKDELLKLGDGWDQERIVRFSDLEKCGQTILGFQSQFAEISSKRKACTEFRDKCKVEFENELGEEESKRQYVEGLGPLPSLLERTKIQDLRDGFQKCDGETHSLEEKKSEFRQGFESLQYLQQQVRERSGTKDVLVLLPESCEDVRKTISAIRIDRHILSRDKIEEYREKVRETELKVSDAEKDCSRCVQEIQSIDEKLGNLSLQLEALSLPNSMVDSSVVDEVRRESGALARLRDELEGLGKEVELKTVSETRAREMLGGQVKDADLLDESKLSELRKIIEQKIAFNAEKDKELAGVGARLSEAQNSLSETESECEALASKIETMRFRLGEEERLVEALSWCEKFDYVQEECERQRVRLNHLQERLNDKQASLNHKQASLGKVLEESSRKKQIQMSIAVLSVCVVAGSCLFVLVNKLVGSIIAIAGVVGFFIIKSRKVAAIEAIGDVETEALRKDVGQLGNELAVVKKTLESSCGSLKELTEQLNVDGSVNAIKAKRETVEAELGDWKEVKKSDLEIINLRKRLESRKSVIEDLNAIIKSIGSEIEKAKLELGKCFDMVDGVSVAPQAALEKLTQLESLRQARQSVIDAESRKKGVLSVIEGSIKSLEKLTHLDGLSLVDSIGKVKQWLQDCPTEERSSREVNNLQYSKKELEERQKSLSIEKYELEALLQLARERSGKAKAAWHGHLDNHGLQSDLSFESANKLCENVDLAESTFQKLKTITEDLRNLEESVSNYFRLAEKLMQLKETGSLYDHLSEVRNFLTECEKNDEFRKKHEKANADVEACKGRIKAAQERLELSERKLEESIREDEGLRNEWRSWLVEKGLNSSMLSAAAYEAIQAVRSCKEIVNRVMAANADFKERELTVERFVGRSTQLYKAISRPIPETYLLFGDFEDVIALFDAEQNKAGAHKKVKENLAARLDAKLKAESEFKAAQGRVDGLLSKAKCQNELEFRQRHATQLRRRELVQLTASMENSLCRILDEKDSSCLEKRYGSFDVAAAALKKVELEREISKLNEEIEGKLASDGEVTSGLRFEISRLQSEREVLIRSREMADLRLRLERAIAEAEALAREWTRLSIANALLQRAKNRFEHEGQPQVLELGSEFFSSITGNKYTGLNVNANSKSNRLEAMIGKERISADVLSTGTQEQLYLSLRFGFIKHRGRTTEPLPVIMDDILVNFDPYRARKAAETIYRLSSSQQQILVFTCHPSTIEIFGKVAPLVRTVEIKSGKLTLLPSQVDGENESSKPEWMKQKNIRDF